MRGLPLVDGVRTAQRRYSGVLATVRQDDLAAQVVAEVLHWTGVPGEAIDGIEHADCDACALRSHRRAQATLCVGVGQGVSIALERL